LDRFLDHFVNIAEVSEIHEIPPNAVDTGVARCFSWFVARR